MSPQKPSKAASTLKKTQPSNDKANLPKTAMSEGSTEKKPTPLQKETLGRLQKQRERYPALKFKKGEDGELLSLTETDPTQVRCQLLETVGTPDASLGQHLLQQALKAQPTWSAEVNTTSALLQGLAPQDTLEGLLATQMSAAHELAMDFARRAMAKDQSVEAVDRNVNRSTKMMRTFIAQVEALNKYRNKGQQTIQVQHVNVNEGGQAIVGTVHQGGGGHERKSE